MADKTGIADLLPILENLCAEHQAMRALLEESDPENWRHDVARLKNQPRPRSRIQEQFREVHESLQSSESDAPVVQQLIEALNKAHL